MGGSRAARVRGAGRAWDSGSIPCGVEAVGLWYRDKLLVQVLSSITRNRRRDEVDLEN